MSQLFVEQLILLTIKRIGINGEGIGFYKRKAVFVDGALPGEVVEVKITKTTQKFAYGEITKFKQKSPQRVEPKCDHFTQCRCSDLQHLDYQEQLVQKQNLLLESFNRYFDGNVNKVNIQNIISSPQPWRMRTFLQLPTRHDGDKVVVGMYERGSNRLVHIDDCFINDEFLQMNLQATLDYLTKANISVYNHRYNQGSLKNLIIKVCPHTKESMLIAVLFENDKYLLNVLRKLPGFTSVYYTINDDPKTQGINNEVIHLAGAKTITIKSHTLELQMMPESFYLPNYEQTGRFLLEQAHNGLFNENETVVSLFSSIGIIEQLISPFVNEVIGIENDHQLYQNAVLNLKQHHPNNIKYHVGEITQQLEEVINNTKIDTLIINPPRSGIDLKMVRLLQTTNINKIIYISSNPSTFAKNINHLQRQYDIIAIQPIDSFPQSINFEIVALLQLRRRR